MKEIYGKLREEHVQLLRTVSCVPFVDYPFVDLSCEQLAWWTVIVNHNYIRDA